MKPEEIKCDKCEKISPSPPTPESVTATNTNNKRELEDSNEPNSSAENALSSSPLSHVSSPKKRSLVNQAIAKCLNCSHFLCIQCLIAHQHFTSNLSHQLVPVGSVESSQQVGVEINNNKLPNGKNLFSALCDDTREAKKDADIQVNEISSNIEVSSSSTGYETNSGQEINQSPSSKSLNSDSSTTSISNRLNEKELEELRRTNTVKYNQHVIKMQLKQQQEQYAKYKRHEQIQQQEQMGVEAMNQQRMAAIEAEINKTFVFFSESLKERKDYLVKELNTIVQFALLNHSQSINKQVQVQYQLELKKQQVEKELSETYDMLNNQSSANTANPANASNNFNLADFNIEEKLELLNELSNLISLNNELITHLKATNPLMSIEFVSHYSTIQTSIRNTFGFVRLNQQQQPQSSNNVFGCSQTPNNHAHTPPTIVSHKPPLPPTTSSSTVTGVSSELNILCNEFKPNVPPPLNLSNVNNAAATASPSDQACSSPTSAKKKQKLDNYKFPSVFDQSCGSDSIVNSTQIGTDHSSSLKTHRSSTDLSGSKFSHTYLNAQQLQQQKQQHTTIYNPACHSSSSLASSTIQQQTQHQMPSGSHHQPHTAYNHQSSHGNLGASYSGVYEQMIMKNPTVGLTRSKMIYHSKFGEFGINDGQFTEPSGVTINTNNDIIVADTNSHRIQIFDREGNFKFKFGECGKRDGQLLYPNRVSIVKHSGDIVVTERSPTHQIQIYNKYGVFLRKFGAQTLQHPRGVYVDYMGRVVVVECKVMRVIIFDLNGNVLNKFNCSKYLEFPNGVCCSRPALSNDFREEIYISDNRAHCIKVFDYKGNYLRQIGGEGITNYPIGVGINCNNEILVADNHNNFNLTVFTQDGKLINALESKVKHAQCFDVGLMDDGSIVLASKDYRIYVYKYSSNMEENSTNSLCSPTSSSNNFASASSSASNLGHSSSSNVSNLMMNVGTSVNKYRLFADNNNNATDSFSHNSSQQLSSYIKTSSSFGDNFTGRSTSGFVGCYFSDLEGSENNVSHNLVSGYNFLSNTNEKTDNEFNLSANTPKTKNLVSLLSGIL